MVRWLIARLDRPGAIRWLGAMAVLVVAASAWLGGAVRTPDATSPLQVLRHPRGVLTDLLWLVGIATLCIAWWLGQRHVDRGTMTNRWVVTTAVLWILPIVAVPPIGSRDVYAYACQGAVVAAGHSPYVEGVAALPCRWLGSVSLMWRDTPSPYGPLFLVLAGAIAQLGSQIAAIAAFRALAVLGIALVAVALPRLARWARVPVGRALWYVLASPIVVVLLIGGAHNDALAVGLLVAGFALIVSRHRVAAVIGGGVLIGLAMAIKVAVGASLPFAVLVAVGRPTPLTRAGVLRGLAVLGAAVGALFGMSYGSGLDLGWLTALRHSGDVRLWTSPPTGFGIAIGYLGRLFGWHAHPEVATRVIALIVLPVVILAIAWLAREHHRIYGTGLALMATIALAPIFEPWYLAWPLVMFAVTAVPTRWFTVLVVVASFVELPDGNGFSRLVQIPGSLVMAAFVIWFAIRGPRRVRSSFETAGDTTSGDVTDGDAREAQSSHRATLAR